MASNSFWVPFSFPTKKSNLPANWANEILIANKIMVIAFTKSLQLFSGNPNFTLKKMNLRHTRYLISAFTTPLRLNEPFDEIVDFDHRFRGILRRHLAILAWWSILNILFGLFALLFLDGQLYYFATMSMVCNQYADRDDDFLPCGFSPLSKRQCF